MYTTVKISNDTLLNMLQDRLEYHRIAGAELDMYMDMYEHMVDGCVFESIEFDPLYIVDNDVITNCAVIKEGEDNFDKLLAVYRQQGLGDCSCDDTGDSGANFIEAVDDKDEPNMLLIRY